MSRRTRVVARRAARIVCVALLLLASARSAGAAPGDLDPSFGTAGLVHIESGPWGERFYTWGAARTLDPLHLDAIVLVSVATSQGVPAVATATVGPSGSLLGFADPGLTDCTLANCWTFFAVEADPTDPGHRLYAVGSASSASTASSRFLVARLSATGEALDPTWGGGSPVLTDIPGTTQSRARALVVQPDGKLLVAGVISESLSGTALARYDTNGTLDTTFGSGGTIVLQGDHVTSLALQDDGRIVLAGHFSEGPTSGFGVKRLHGDGSADASFGTDDGLPGIATTGFARQYTQGVAIGVDVLPDGRIVAAGSDWDPFHERGSFVAARYLPDGRLDRSFNAPTGRIRKRVGRSCGAGDVAFQSDGKILIGGGARRRHPEHHTDIALLRLDANGRPDRSYGRGGQVQTPILPDSQGLAVEDVILDTTGRATVVARVADGTGLATILAHYLP